MYVCTSMYVMSKRYVPAHKTETTKRIFYSASPKKTLPYGPSSFHAPHKTYLPVVNTLPTLHTDPDMFPMCVCVVGLAPTITWRADRAGVTIVSGQKTLQGRRAPWHESML